MIFSSPDSFENKKSVNLGPICVLCNNSFIFEYEYALSVLLNLGFDKKILFKRYFGIASLGSTT